MKPLLYNGHRFSLCA